MDNINIPLLGGLIGFFFGLFESLPRLKKISQIRRMASFSISANPVESMSELTGDVVTESQKILSPLTQTPCVFWRAEVLELRESGEDSYWENIFEGTSVHPFYVLDLQNGTGIYTVYPSGAEFLLHTDMFQESASHVNLEPKIMKALERLPIAPISSKGLEKPLQIREQIITADETIYILSTAKEKNGARVISASRDGSPFLISDRSQHAVLVTLYWRVIASIFLFTILGVFMFLLFIGKIR